MKKLIALMLAVVLALSLAACGKNNSANDEAAQEGETQKGKTATMYLNETLKWGDLEFTILDVRPCDSDGFSVGYSTGTSSYGGPSIAVTYSLKNIGKADNTPTGNILQLNYADGYTFNSKVQVNGRDPDIYANGGINTPTTLPVLSEAHYYLEAFTVPEEVITATDKPLYLTFAFADSVEKSPFRYDIRPVDEKQKELLYQHITELMNNRRFSSAFMELADIQDYKDSADLRTECALNCLEYSEYLKDKFDTFETLSGESLSNALPGTWSNIGDVETWKISADGTFDPDRTAPVDGSKVTGKWSVKGETLSMSFFGANNSKFAYDYKVKKVGDCGLILFSEENGKVSIQKQLVKE